MFPEVNLSFKPKEGAGKLICIPCVSFLVCVHSRDLKENKVYVKYLCFYLGKTKSIRTSRVAYRNQSGIIFDKSDRLHFSRPNLVGWHNYTWNEKGK